MNSNNNYTNLALMLELLSTSLSYQEVYIEKFPENETHVLSFSVDPNCSCKNQLIDHFKQHSAAIDELTQTFLQKNPNEIDLPAFLKRIEVTNVAGRVFVIDKTPEAYASFVENMKDDRWAFRHISVTADENNYTIFFA